jgi:hypothetical protein
MRMNIPLFLNGNLLGVTSLDNKAGLDIFCEQYGLTLVSGDNRLDITTNAISPSVYISTNSNSKLSLELISLTKSFISAEGISVKTGIDNESYELLLCIDVIESKPDKAPLLLIEHPSNFNEQLKNLFIVELNRANIAFTLKENNVENQRYISRYLHLNCYVLKDNLDLEKVALSIARAIILFKYYNRKKRTIVNYTSQAMIRSFVKSFLTGPSEIIQKQQYEDQIDTPQQEDRLSEQNSNGDKLVIHSEKPSSKKALLEPKIEAFFDYSVLIPRLDEDELIIKGALIIKNTGEEKVSRPIICFKIPLESDVILQGQFLPPNLVSGLSTKGMEGDKGWKYIYSNWRDRIKSNGEYWIEPIQQLEIEPGEKITINGLSIYVKGTKKAKSILVQAFVYFQDGKYRFSSNNSIAISY